MMWSFELFWHCEASIAIILHVFAKVIQKQNKPFKRSHDYNNHIMIDFDNQFNQDKSRKAGI